MSIILRFDQVKLYTNGNDRWISSKEDISTNRQYPYARLFIGVRGYLSWQVLDGTTTCDPKRPDFTIDSAIAKSFVAREFPLPIFADYLEETLGSQLPEEIYCLLRNAPAESVETVTLVNQ